MTAGIIFFLLCVVLPLTGLSIYNTLIVIPQQEASIIKLIAENSKLKQQKLVLSKTCDFLQEQVNRLNTPIESDEEFNLRMDRECPKEYEGY